MFVCVCVCFLIMSSCISAPLWYISEFFSFAVAYFNANGRHKMCHNARKARSADAFFRRQQITGVCWYSKCSCISFFFAFSHNLFHSIITFSCCFHLPEKEFRGCTTFTTTNETQFLRITKYALLMNNFQYFAVSAQYIGDAHQMMLIL